jgi:TolB-like protein
MRYVSLFSILFFILSFTALQAREVISVLYFNNTTNNREYSWLRKGLADMLITDLVNSGQVNVIERNDLQKVLTEIELAQSGLIDDKKAIKAGKLLNAQKLIYGNYVLSSNSIHIDARITDTKTAKILSAVSVQGSINKLFYLQQLLSKKLFQKLGIKGEPAVPDTESKKAAKNYYEGLDLYDKGKTKEALDKFEKSRDEDAIYVKPQKGISEGYTFLKNFKKARNNRELAELHELANALRKRIESKNFISTEEMMKRLMQSNMSQPEMQQFLNKFAYTSCSTRATCAALLISKYISIAQKESEISGKWKREKNLCQRAANLANSYVHRFRKDPYAPQLAYTQLLALYCARDNDGLLYYSRKFLETWPNYQMITLVESWYERALEDKKREEEYKKRQERLKRR